MPTTFAEDWKKAKEAFTRTTNAKKPSASFMGVFNKGTGISAALKSADSAKTVGDLYAAMKAFKTASDEYTKTLDKAIADPKVTDAAAKAVYVTAATKLKEELKDIYTTAGEVAEQLVGLQKKEGVHTGALKGEAEAKLKQVFKPLEKLWSKDFGDVVKGRIPWLTMTGYVVELKVNGDILDLLDKEDGGATAAFMIEDANKLCVTYGEKYLAELGKLEGNRKTSMKELSTKATELFKQLHPHLVAEVEKIAKTRFDKFRNDKPMYREYQIKTGVAIATGTLQVAGGIVAVAAAAPTHGATLPLAVVGLARGVYGTSVAISQALKSVEKLQSDLVSSLESLTKAYLTESGKASTRMKVQEMGAAVLAGILGSDALFVESLPKCNKAYEAWKGQVAGLRVDHRKLTKESLELIAKANELEAELKASPSEKIKKLAAKGEKIREGAGKGLDKAHALGDRITNAEAVETKLEEGLKELNSANPNYVKVFTVLFPAAVNVGLAAGGAGIDFGAGVAGAELANTVLGLSSEVLANVKEVVESATSK